jgi:hypothetical protein
MDHPRRGASTAIGVIDPMPGHAISARPIQTLRTLALEGLGPMYDREAGRFVFRVRRSGSGIVREGLSTRYTAITAIGLAQEDASVVRELLAGARFADLLRRLIDDADNLANLGDLAVLAWAGRLWDCNTGPVWNRIQTLGPDSAGHPTIEVAWTLSASVVDACAPPAVGTRLAQRLRQAFAPDAGLFPHQLDTKGSLRAHVSCFADFVYPTLALAQFGRATDDCQSIACSARSAETMCRLQGADGQWWWHFDYRTGRVVEGYPVYSVHQDSMAPMALFAAADAVGRDFSAAIDRGLKWLWSAPELEGRSLVDTDEGVIWRKVARREPAKLSRSVQAVISRVSADMRAPGLDQLFPPTAIDHEDRPYHLGWILYAWPAARASQWDSKAS